MSELQCLFTCVDGVTLLRHLETSLLAKLSRGLGDLSQVNYIFLTSWTFDWTRNCQFS